MKFFGLLTLFGLFSIISGLHHYQRGREVILHNGPIVTTEVPHFLQDERYKRQISQYSDETEYQYMVHVGAPISEEQKDEMEQHIGARLGVYLPHNTYLLVANQERAERATTAPGVLWVGALYPEYKYPRNLESILSSNSPNFNSASLLVHLVPELPENQKRTLEDVEIIAAVWNSRLASSGNVQSVNAVSKDKIQVQLITSGDAFSTVQWLSERSVSHWIEPGFNYKAHNAEANKVIQSDDMYGTPFLARGLDGTGEIVGLADSGIYTTSCYFPGSVTANVFNNASKIVRYVTTFGDFTDADGHGTSVAGTIAGQTTTAISSDYNGLAPGAKLHFTDISTVANVLTPPADLNNLFSGPYADGVKIFVASFGTSNVTWYSSQAHDVDTFSATNGDFLPIVSAGNEGTGSSLSSLALSKNALVVGASQSTTVGIGGNPPAVVSGPGTLANFSSRGPTPDGRIKPDVVAPALSLTSASNTLLCGQSVRFGTSYAAGVAAGAAAITRNWFNAQLFPNGLPNNIGIPFTDGLTADIIKGVLINSGQPLNYFNKGTTYVDLNQFPSSDQGFGRIQLNKVLPLGDNSTAILGNLFVARESVSTGTSKRYCFIIPANAPYFKATLVWQDPAGSLVSGLPLVNNLDLAVITQLGVTYKTNTANGQFDAVNNVEQVLLEAPFQGAYAVYVNGFNVPQGGVQKYALVVSGAQQSAVCNINFDIAAERVCPSACSGRGTCNDQGFCNCTNPAVRGLDCTVDPCPSGCSDNGVCDYTTGKCICGNNYALPDCAALIPPSVTAQAPPPQVITVPGGTSGIATGVFIGVVIAAFIVGCLLALILGGFGAVKFLEYKRDQAHKEQEGQQNADL